MRRLFGVANAAPARGLHGARLSATAAIKSKEALARLAKMWTRKALYLTFGSAASILFSIAVSQILLALALAALLFSGEKLRFPPILLPLALFFSYTVVSVLLSDSPSAGTPQIRKFFVYAIVLLIFSTFESARHIRGLVLAWAAVTSLSAAYSLIQFLHRHKEAQLAGTKAYAYLIDGRITGFASHWMTFGGEQMIVLLMLLSLALFSRERRWKLCGWICTPLLFTSIVLGLTRSILLLGLPAGALYLLWNRKRWTAVALPAAAVILVLAMPSVRERVISVVRPRDEMDKSSNAQRAIMRQVGWEIIKAHPWFGLGPEQIQRHFEEYTPSSVPRPLPRGWYGHLHNIYLQYAAERGVPALLLILWLIGKALFDFSSALRIPRRESGDAFALHGAIAVTLAVLAEGFFEHNLGDSEVLTLFLTVVACGYVARRNVLASASERRDQAGSAAPGAYELNEVAGSDQSQ